MKFMYKFKIGYRLAFVFAVIIALNITSLLYNKYGLETLHNNLDQIYNTNFMSVEYLIEADRDAYQSSVAITNAFFYARSYETEKTKKELGSIIENIDQVKTRYSKFAKLYDTQSKQHLKSIDSIFWANYNLTRIFTDSIINNIEKKQVNNAVTLYYGDYSNYFELMRNAMDQFTGIHLEESQATYNASNETTQAIVMSSIIITLSIILAVILLSYVLIKSITVPLAKAVEITKAVANGNLTFKTEQIEGTDETSTVLRSINDMTEKIKDIVQNIRQGSDNIVNSSNQINEGATQIAQGASEQAASTEQVSSSIEQMSANITQNSENAQQTEQIALLVAEQMNEVQRAVNETVQSMKTITNKIQVINEISEKTNLLAVNAAIEAARAGEQGKGFAVVAGEVRKLAENSQAAALEIAEISTKSVIVAENSGTLLSGVIPDVQRTAQLVQEITAANIEQSSGTKQINQAIQQLTSVTQENSASSEEFSANSFELKNQATALNNAISFFKISKEEIDEFSDKEIESQIEKLTEILMRKKAGRTKTETENTIKKIASEKSTKQNQNQKKEGVSIKLAEESDDDQYEKF